MKILAFSDLHLGSGAAYADDRLADQLKVLEQIAQIVYEQEIALVLIAGDVFHRPRPTPATLLAFRKFVDVLAAFEVPTIACLGNVGHDQEGIDRPCALDLFASRWFRVSRRPELIWDFVDSVAVATLPSVPVSRLVAQSESSERGPVFDQAAEALLAVAGELRQDAETMSSEHKPTILMGHWSVSGASLPNGLSVDSLNEPILDLASLERLNYDAIVLGHIHHPGPLGTLSPYDEAMPIFYCGSPACVDFGEAGESHGCWTFDSDSPASSLRFHPLEDRRFLTLEYDCDSPVDMQFLAPEGDMLGFASIEDAVVRVKYHASEEQHRRVDTAALKRRLLAAGAHRVFQISAEIMKQDRARVQGVDENLDPATALALWCEANEINDGARGENLLQLLNRYSVTAP